MKRVSTTTTTHNSHARLQEVRRFFEDYEVVEHKQVLVEDLLGPEDVLRLIRESLALYRQLRRGELKHV